MKIAISTPVIQRGRSGVGQYVLSLVRSLLPATTQHEIALYILEADVPLFAFAQDAMRIETVAERHRPAVKNIAWHQTALPRRVRRAAIDVLHVPSYRRMLWPRPCALVATIHDLAPFQLAGKYDWARMVYGRVIARALAHRQDEIIAVSRETASGLDKYFKLPAERVTVVPNGLDHDAFQPGSDQRVRYSICARRGVTAPFFLYVARLEHPAKNHVRLIAAFNQFKAQTGSIWQLVLGGGDWHGAEVVHAAVTSSPFARDIVRLGFVPAEELPAWYRAAGAMVFPSLYEGFGLPPTEAMACGCPVLSSRRGALAETVGAAAALLEPEDIPQMQSQLMRAATDTAWRAQLSAAGLIRARAFDWRTTATATLAVYERAYARVVASGRHGRADAPADTLFASPATAKFRAP